MAENQKPGDSDKLPDSYSYYPTDLAIEATVYNRDQHCISRANIDSDALKIMYRLNRFGHKAYLVGGGVRDLLLHKQPKDFDIATNATPRQIKSLFRNCRIIGRRFKLAHIYFKNRKIIETATFRDVSESVENVDDAGDDNEPHMIIRDNKYGTEATDALRRDITINALFYDIATFSIIDYVGGMEDIERKVIRVIGDPNIRFAEDPVRLIRVVRHAVRAGFDIEDSCLAAVINNHELLLHCPPMRLYEEVKKDLLSGYLFEILRGQYENKLLQHLLPELADASLFEKNSDFSLCLGRLDKFCREKEDIPVTAVVALLALFLNNHDYSAMDLSSRFSNNEELSEYLNNCFTQLAVPRKERERIEHLLRLWLSIENEVVHKINPRRLEKRKQIEELYWLMLFLYGKDSDDELLSTVKEARLRSRERNNNLNKAKNKKRESRSRANKIRFRKNFN